MDSNYILVLAAMLIYIAVLVGIGLCFARRSNRSSDDYFLGGRSLGAWVAALSA